MRTLVRTVFLVVVSFGILTACGDGRGLGPPSPRAGAPAPVPVQLDAATTHEQASILFACDEARGVRDGVFVRGSILREKALWVELRAHARSLAEQGAALAWNELIDRATDAPALDGLVQACRRSGH